MSEALPFVTVIMPIRNKKQFIERSLGAVLTQDYPHDRIEVIVADGMSSDGTRDIIQRLCAQHSDSTVIIIDNPHLIVSTGLNHAIRTARGEIIVRVDGRTIIEPDYVRECVAALERTGADNVGGRMNAVGTRSVLGQAIALATSSPFGVGGARFHYSTDEEWVDTVYMGAWRRDTLERFGGFDEEMVRNQDDELNYRLRAHGGKILLSPRIRSRYYNRTTLGALWEQYFYYGYWKVRVLQKHPAQMRPRQFAPPLLVGALLSGLFGGMFSQLVRHLWFLLVLVYSTANLSAALLTARRFARSTPLPHPPAAVLRRLPLVYATLHIAYGLGFVVGMVKFRNYWLYPSV